MLCNSLRLWTVSWTPIYSYSSVFVIILWRYKKVSRQKNIFTSVVWNALFGVWNTWGVLRIIILHKYITFNKELGWIFRNPSLVMFSFLSRVALPIPFRLQRSVIHSKHSNYVYAWHELFCILNIEWKTKWLLLTSMAINLLGKRSLKVRKWNSQANTTDSLCQCRL